MFIRMRESKGFTLVELMVVVAIIGILAAVAIPYYQKYIQKSRLVSKIFPGIHAIENNLAAYYAFQSTFPITSAVTSPIFADADTECFGTPAISGSGSSVEVLFTVRAGAATCEMLQALNGDTLGATPQVSGGTNGGLITGWQLSGSLAENLGLQGEK